MPHGKAEGGASTGRETIGLNHKWRALQRSKVEGDGNESVEGNEGMKGTYEFRPRLHFLLLLFNVRPCPLYEPLLHRNIGIGHLLDTRDSSVRGERKKETNTFS